MIKGAIFDMDGTLFDTERLYAGNWTLTAEQFGQTPDPDFPYAVAGTTRGGQEEIVRQYYPTVDAGAFVDACTARMDRALECGVPEKPGVHEILTFFRERGIKLAVASSNSRHKIEANLQRAGINDLFDLIVSGEEVEHGKPAPDIFVLAAENLGFSPEECYVFEDSINGVQAGIAAGCATVMIPDLFPPTEDLRRHCLGIYPTLLEAQQKIAVTADMQSLLL